jgi:hypothetical protein
VLHAREERRRDGAEADEKDADTTLGWGDFLSLHFHEVFSFQDDASLAGKRDQRLVPLRRDAPGIRPMLYGALASAEEISESALPTEASDDALCRVGEVLLGCHAFESNDIFVSPSSNTYRNFRLHFARTCVTEGLSVGQNELFMN